MSVGFGATAAVVLWLTVLRPGLGKANTDIVYFFVVTTLSVICSIYYDAPYLS